MTSGKWILWTLISVPMLFAGCNRGGLNLAPVEGVVTYKGAPVTQAGVLFKPVTGPIAIGTTDGEGHFRLRTANQDGALIGDHRVAVTKTQQLASQVTGEHFPRYETKYLIPQKFGSPETSELTSTVTSGKNQVEFALK